MTKQELDGIVNDIEGKYTGRTGGKCPFHKSGLLEIDSPRERRKYFGCPACSWAYTTLDSEEMKREYLECQMVMFEAFAYVREKHRNKKTN